MGIKGGELLCCGGNFGGGCFGDWDVCALRVRAGTEVWGLSQEVGGGGILQGQCHCPLTPLPHRPVQELPPPDCTPRVHLQRGG